MELLVAEANGHSGRLIIQYLIEKGHEAYAMVRNENQGTDLKN